jgi:hypothetical protein
MTAERYVLAGLARAHAAWFQDVARWSTSAVLPADFVMAMSVEELRARLQAGRSFSALLVDGGLPGCDRDLADLATVHGCALLVVEDGTTSRPWDEMGAAAVLPPDFTPDDLHGVLQAVARPIARPDVVVDQDPGELATAPQIAWRGRVVVVTGSGGTGRSTLAMAVAAGLAADPRDQGLVLLADLALHAHQGLLHDAGDVVPGLYELVEAHRSTVLSPEAVRQLCFQVPHAGYDVLLGLRRHRDWAGLRPRPFGAALDALRRSYRLVVADVDADVEGQDDCGSAEVEERNLLARATLGQADLVVATGLAAVTGIHAHVRVLRDLLELGVPGDRLVPVVNRAPRNPRARAEVSRALTQLLGVSAPGRELATTPFFVPDRRRLDDVLRDEARPPESLVHALAGPVRALLERLPARDLIDPLSTPRPVAVVPGSLGSWSAAAEEAGS